ncbi:hypothetical protein CDD83_5141 [Cordyceps sp. RAO-2017]|nr:hypothetical protein CDD83_5141 [Cordyceps sp. RAO-2017]
MAMLVGESSVRGSSELVRMVLLTFVAIGITFTWGVEMTCEQRPFPPLGPCPADDDDDDDDDDATQTARPTCSTWA